MTKCEGLRRWREQTSTFHSIAAERPHVCTVDLKLHYTTAQEKGRGIGSQAQLFSWIIGVPSTCAVLPTWSGLLCRNPKWRLTGCTQSIQCRLRIDRARNRRPARTYETDERASSLVGTAPLLIVDVPRCLASVLWAGRHTVSQDGQTLGQTYLQHAVYSLRLYCERRGSARALSPTPSSW